MAYLANKIPNEPNLGNAVEATLISERLNEGSFRYLFDTQEKSGYRAYWYGDDNYIEIYIPTTVNIWRMSDSYYNYNGKLKILKLIDGEYKEIQLVETLGKTNNPNWEKWLSNVGEGTYRFAYAGQLRMDSEWYLEKVPDKEIIVAKEVFENIPDTNENLNTTMIYITENKGVFIEKNNKNIVPLFQRKNYTETPVAQGTFFNTGYVVLPDNINLSKFDLLNIQAVGHNFNNPIPILNSATDQGYSFTNSYGSSSPHTLFTNPPQSWYGSSASISFSIKFPEPIELDHVFFEEYGYTSRISISGYPEGSGQELLHDTYSTNKLTNLVSIPKKKYTQIDISVSGTKGQSKGLTSLNFYLQQTQSTTINKIVLSRLAKIHKIKINSGNLDFVSNDRYMYYNNLNFNGEYTITGINKER